MKVVVIDYGSGNLRSCAKAFERAANDHNIKANIIVSPNPDDVLTADRIVLPGVGAFADCRSGLDAVSGLVDAMNEAVIKNGKPFFGICVGMQLMADVGREFGDTNGLGWIGGEVVAMKPSNPNLKIPHMGWNDLKIKNPHPLLAGLPIGGHAYFVHSYQFAVSDEKNVAAEIEYGGLLSAVIAKDNMVGTQFHPEKSQGFGLGIIANFLSWNP
ncbi:MAG: imidazole glycerol phosphate synthase subunit HisH [Rhodospirillaceae bacterium]|nr:imidazole glycerol phosphate synthase subunit HisH [Rhodospirillaceae bacterium]